MALTIKGDKLETFPLDLRAVADLIYCDGPLVSLFESHWEGYYYNRWLVFRISDIQITSYLLGVKLVPDGVCNSARDNLAHIRGVKPHGRGCKPNAIKLRINSFSFNRILALYAYIFWCRKKT